MYSGREIYDPQNLDFRDRHGAKLDLMQDFQLDDDPEDTSHFLRTTGYLVVRRAFDAALIAELSDSAAAPTAHADGSLLPW